jgi:hypothetical protein
LKEPGLKLGVKKTYAQTFEGLRTLLDDAERILQDISAMFSSSFKQLNAEYGMSLQLTAMPDLAPFRAQLAEIEQDHVQYLSVGHTFKLAQPEFCERLGRALLARLRDVYESAGNAMEVWNKAAATQLDSQLKERRHNFSRRVEAVTRIQEAAGGLAERMAELSLQLDGYAQLDQALHHQAHQMLHHRGVAVTDESVSD